MRKFVQILLILLVSAGYIFAQGEDPNIEKPKTAPKKATKPTPKNKSIPKSGAKTTALKNSGKSKTAKKPTVRPAGKIQYGSLQISVSEPDSRIFLSNENGNALEEDSVVIEEEMSPLTIDDLQTESYTLTIRKEGYFESSQKIFIAAGKVNSISVSLKPSAAFLSVNTNADGVIIEIETVGEYENQVENLLLAPGTYQINVYKNGYVGESKQIQLSAAGQKSAVDFQLKPLPVARLLADAQASFDRRDYDAAIKNCRQILAAEPLNPKANRLAGASYFNLTKPIDGAFLISRAVGSGEQFTFPARIFNKEKNNLQLPSGDLTVTRTALQFKSATNSSLNFYIVNKDGIELLEKTDEFGVDYISLKAKGNFGGKDDKRTVRLYAEQANVKASRKELACPKCTPAFCLCRNGRQAMFEIFSRWAKNDFTSPRAGFGAVMSPSAEFVAFQADGYALKLPENWQALVENNGQILAAPSGAYNQTQNQFEYSHGINAISLPNPNRLDLSQLTDNFLRSVIERNSYLKSSASSETNLRGRRTRVNKLSGSSPTSQRDESITIYTMTMPSNNNLLVIMTITPPDEAAEYANTFRRILNSLTFSD